MLRKLQHAVLLSLFPIKTPMVFPFFSRITEKKHVFFSHFRQSYVCGKKMLSQEGVGLPKKARPASGRNFKSRSKEKERTKMSNKNNNQINIPQAREAMDRFKMQAAQEVGVNLTNGYNGHLTSREAGSVGGQMVKKMIEAYEQGMQ